MNIFNVFSARFFAAAKLCVFSFVLVNLPFSVNAQSADLHNHSSNYSSDILEAKKEEAHKKRRLEQLTLMLAKQIKQNKNNKNSINSNQLNDLIDTAQSRQTLLSELLELSPNAVKRSKLPTKISNNAPDEIKQYLLQQQELEGELEIFYEDYERVELSRLRHVLKTKTGRVELHFADTKSLSNLKHGKKVKAKGLLVKSSDSEGSASALIENQTEVALLADDGTTVTTASVSPAQLANTLGEQKTLVLLVNFQDSPTEQPWTKEEVEEMVFGTVNDYYQEASYGQTWLAGDVMGYYTLSINSVCDNAIISSETNQLAIDNGLNLNQYQRLIYVFPKIDNCGWSGKGTVGGSQSKAWINGSLSLRTVGHELGHNLGLYHAKKLECDTNVLSGDCYAIEYGDSSDIMGASGVTGHFNAFNKDQLQWLSDESSAKINTIESDGTFLLEPYELDSESSLKSVKIARGLDPSSGEQLWYYLEYRQPLGFDAYLSSFPKITSGILFHLASGENLNTSQLIDMTPASASADWNDSALAVGENYTDEQAGISITTDWSNESGASISVSFDERCINRPPELSISSSENNWAEAGDIVEYSVSVRNLDSETCASSNYEVAVLHPENWSSGTETLSLMPNEIASVNLTVTSSSQAENGFYELDVIATNSDNPSVSSSDTLSYVVSTPEPICNREMPAVQLISYQNLSGETEGSVKYTLSVSNQDSIDCPMSDLSIFADVSNGWTTTTENVSLTPTGTAIVDVVVSQAETATAGTYNFDINALNQSATEYVGVESVTYIVEPGATCSASDPLIELLDSAIAIVQGEAVMYKIAITNQDSVECDEVTYSINSFVPSQWSSSSANVILLPNESTTVDVLISSSENSAAGNYQLLFEVTNVLDPTYQSSEIVEINLTEAANLAPDAVNDDIEISSKQQTEINVLANDTDVENDTLTIVSVTQGAKGQVTISSSGTISYYPAKRFKNSDYFTYTVSDGKNESTATVTIRLVSSGDSGGSNNKGKKK